MKALFIANVSTAIRVPAYAFAVGLIAGFALGVHACHGAEQAPWTPQTTWGPMGVQTKTPKVWSPPSSFLKPKIAPTSELCLGTRLTGHPHCELETTRCNAAEFQHGECM